MRTPVAQGFYPQDKEILKKTISALFSKAKPVKCPAAIGAVVPHAGYAYSGLTAASVYASLPAKYHTALVRPRLKSRGLLGSAVRSSAAAPRSKLRGFQRAEDETIILLGTNHTGYGQDIAVSFDDWLTPLGEVKNDTDVGKKICKLSKFAAHDELAHRYEHSIEVQLPFLQMKFKDFKIVPIAVSSGLEPGQYANLAGAIKKAAEGKNVLVIASSDFTHYGKMYGFAPEAKDTNKWVHETDRKIIDAILACDAEKFIELAEKSTVCGAGAIATLIYFAGKKKGALIDYRTSCDISGDKSAIVGYASIIF